jgi:hypothetical protein
MPYRRFQTARQHQTSRMRCIGKISVLALLLVVRALAQDRLQTGPPIAAYGPAYDFSLGYNYLSSNIPSAGRVNLNGLDGSASLAFRQHWGATVDSAYVRTSDVLGTGHTGYVLTLLAGPAFYPVARRNMRMFVRGLVGAGLVDSAVPQSGTRYLRGWVERPAYAAGGGIEHSFVGPFAIRVGGDYLRTAFVDSAGAVRLQNNLRLTTSIVLRLKPRP